MSNGSADLDSRPPVSGNVVTSSADCTVAARGGASRAEVVGSSPMVVVAVEGGNERPAAAPLSQAAVVLRTSSADRSSVSACPALGMLRVVTPELPSNNAAWACMAPSWNTASSSPKTSSTGAVIDFTPSWLATATRARVALSPHGSRLRLLVAAATTAGSVSLKTLAWNSASVRP